MQESLIVSPGYPTPILARSTDPDKPGQNDGGWDSEYAAAAYAFHSFGMWENWQDRVFDPTKALTYSVLWGCVSYIAQTIASLGWHQYEKLPRGQRKIPLEDPVSWLLGVQASPEMNSFDFRQVMLKDALLWGNGYAEIERTGGGRPYWFWRLDPGRVQPERDDAGDLYYRVRNNPGSGGDTILDPANVFHLKGLSADGLMGYSVIHMARHSIELGLQEERFGSSFFKRGLMPGGMLEIPGVMKKPERDELRTSFQKTYGGSENAGRVVVLTGGAKFSPVTMPNSDAQWLESRTFQADEIARWFRVPPHKVGLLARATFSNIEQQSIEAVQDCLLPWCRRLESEADIKLFGRNTMGRRYTRLNLDSLLRGDSTTQTTTVVQKINNGVLTPNEGREFFDMNPLPEGGDTPLVQGAMVPLSQVLPGDQGDTEGPDSGELIDVPDVAQEYDYDCGAAAVAAVSEWLADPLPIYADYLRELETSRITGTEVEEIIAFFVRRGHPVEASGNLDIEDLAELVASGRPVICPVQDYGTPIEERADRSGHYVVVVGVALGQVVLRDPSFAKMVQDIGDPSTPHRVVSIDDFLADWHDKGTDGTLYERFGMAVGEKAEEIAEEPEGAMPALLPDASLPSKIESAAIRAFSDDQERDESGRWTDEGGGSGGGDSSAEAARQEREDRHEKEDQDTQERRDAEDQATQKQEEKEDAKIERDREDTKTEREREREDDRIDSSRQKEDDRTEATRQKEDDATESRREKEDAERDAKHEKEDEEADRTKEVIDRREAEQREIDAGRKKEDDTVDSVRQKEDKDREKAREKEDADRKAAREKEDKAIEQAREKEDVARQAKREREDAQLEKTRQAAYEKLERQRKEEDQRTAERRAAESPHDQTGQKLKALRETFTTLLAEVYGRLLRTEADKANKAARNGGVTTWARSFYTSSAEAHVTKAVLPVVEAFLLASGRQGDAGRLAAWLASDHVGTSFADPPRDPAGPRAQRQAEHHLALLWENIHAVSE